jgi:hypothetical protein
MSTPIHPPLASTFFDREETSPRENGDTDHYITSPIAWQLHGGKGHVSSQVLVIASNNGDTPSKEASTLGANMFESWLLNDI